MSQQGQSHNWRVGDHLNFGFRTFGKDALREARRLWTNGFIWRLRALCERFPAEKRYPGVSWNVYTRLKVFPDSITDPILKRAAAEGLGARKCYDLAVEMSGVDPTARLAGKNKSVSIPALLHSKLKKHGNINRIVREILEQWLLGLELTRQPSGQRTDAWRRAVAEA